MRKPFAINGRTIGPGQPTYIIAEMSANHGQSYETAVKIIKAMKEAGADAVKLQTYRPDTITLDSDLPHFKVGKGTLWAGRTFYDLYSEAFTPWEWQPKLKKVAEDLGMHLFSSPFDETAVDFLEEMNVPAYKVASFELVDIPLIQKIAATGKPIIMSVGMGTLEEIQEAVAATGKSPLVLLQCTSAYPAPAEEANLRTMTDLAERFSVVTGLSDHTLGIAVPVAAVSLGAAIIEKHFTLSRADGGPDSAFSLEPQEFKEMVAAIRTAEKAVGQVSYELTPKEEKSRLFRPSLFAVEAIRKGEVFTEQNVKSLRPANGLPPKYTSVVVGKKATEDIARGTPLEWYHVAGVSQKDRDGR